MMRGAYRIGEAAMPSEQAIKERAKQIDPCAFKSYSGSSRRDAQQEALARARRELEWEPPTIKCKKCGWSFTPPMKGGCDHQDCEYTAQPRRYTLNEIDRMRTAIRQVQPFNNPMNPRPGVPSVEDQLRTAMIGGVDPQELEDKADAHWERIRERREVRRREQEANDARIRAGGRAINVMAEAEAVVADAPLNSFWRRIITSRIEAIFSRLRMGSI